MSKLMFVLFRARYGWLLTVGVILAVSLLQRDKLPAAVVVAGLTAVVTAATFVRADLPRLRAMDRGTS